MKVLLAFLLLIYLGVLPALAQTTSGVLSGDETWSGTVVITDDVTVPDGVTLTIDPGTVVKFTKKADPNQVKLIVSGGSLNAIGAGNLITFTSNEATPASADWAAIVMENPGPNTVLHSIMVQYASEGIRFMDYNPGELTNISFSHFRYNKIGVKTMNTQNINFYWCYFHHNNFGATIYNSSEASFESSYLYSNSFIGIHVENSQVRTKYSCLTNNYIGMMFQDTCNGDIEWTVLYGNLFSALSAEAGNYIIKSSILAKNTSYGIYFTGTVNSYDVDYNDVWDNGTNYTQCTPGGNSVSSDPKFKSPNAASPRDGDWHLDSGSPCSATGENGSNMGMYPTPDDSTPPGPVTGFSCTAGDTQVTLGWTNPTDGDFESVAVFRKQIDYPQNMSDGVLVYRGTGTSKVDTGLTNGLKYYYAAFTYDHIPNYSSAPDGAKGWAIPSSGPDTTPPGEIQSFTALPGFQKVTLSWTNPTDPDFAGVKIMRKEGSYPANISDGVSVFNSIGTSVEDTGLTNGTTYYYTAFTYDNVPNYSSGAQVTGIPSSDTTPPPDVTGFTATGGMGQIVLSWTNPTDADFAGVKIMRKTGSAPTGPTDGTMVYEGNLATYTDSTVVNGTTYYYKAFSYDAVHNYSTGVEASAAASGDTTPPGNVTSFTATGGIGQVTLNWTNPTDTDFAGVKIQKKTGGYPLSSTDGSTVYTGTSTSATDTSVTGGTTYYYKAFSYDAVPNYSSGAESSATPTGGGDTTPPGLPQNFRAIPGNAKIVLSWVNPTDTDFAGVRIMRKTDSFPANQNDGTQIFEGNFSTTTDISLTNGQSYYYTIFAFDGVPNYTAAGASVQATATPSSASDTTAPGEVSGFTAVGANAKISLSWTNPSDSDFVSVKILRKEGGYPSNSSDGTEVYNGAGTSYEDTGLTNGTAYYYKAFTYDEVPNYSTGSEATATPTAGSDTTPPQNVGSFTAVAGDSKVTLSWTSPPDTDYTGVKIMRKTGSYPTDVNDGTQIYNGNAQTCEDTGLSNGVTYYYKAFSHDAVPNYASGVEASATPAAGSDTTPPASVSNLNAIPGNQKVSLTWTNPADADFVGTKILRKTGSYPVSAADGTLVYNGPGTAISDDTPPLANGTTYYYAAFAYDEVPNYSTLSTGSKATAVPSASSDTTPPSPPSSFNAVAGNAKVTLTWNNPSDDDFAGVKIMRKEGGYPASVNDGSVVYNGSSTQITDTGLTNGTTYYYAAFAFDEVPNYSSSAQDSATPSGTTDTTAPGPVTDFNAVPGNSKIVLTWSNPADDDLSGVKILRKTTGFPLSSTDGDVVFNNSGTTFEDINVLNNTTYYYAAFAYDEVPNYSSLATDSKDSATPSDTPDTIAPDPVSMLTAIAGNAKISLSWSNPLNDDFVSTSLVRKTGDYPADVNDGTLLYSGALETFVDSSVVNGTEYFYAAFARDEVPNYSQATSGSKAHATPSASTDTTAPGPVKNLKAVPGNTKVVLSWKNPDDEDFAGVKILRKTGSHPVDANDGTVAYIGTGTIHTDSGLINGTTYYYAAFAYDEVPNFSSLSDDSKATSSPSSAIDTTPPASVYSLRAIAGNAQISLSWVNPDDEDFCGIKLLRKTGTYPANSSDGTIIYNGSDANYLDTGLTNGTNYYYAAFAYDEVPNYSAANAGSKASATPSSAPDNTPPASIANLKAIAGNGKIVLRWSLPSDEDLAGVIIKRKTGTYPTAYNDGTTVYEGLKTNFTDLSLANGTTYYYAAFAYDEIPNYSPSAAGSLASATPSATADTSAPGEILNFGVVAGDSELTLSWSNPTDDDFCGVRILRKTGTYPGSINDGTVVFDGYANSFRDLSVYNGVTYYYSAFAYDEVPNYSSASSGAQGTGTPVGTVPNAEISAVISRVGLDSDNIYHIGSVVKIVVKELHEIDTFTGSVSITGPGGFQLSAAALTPAGGGEYYYDWNTAGRIEGTYSVNTRLGTDTDGVPADPDLTITLTDATAPIIETITSSVGSNQSGSYPLGATITFLVQEKNSEPSLSGTVEVKSLSKGVVSIGNVTYAGSGIYQYTWNTTNLDNSYVLSDYKVSAWLRDSTGNEGSSLSSHSFALTNPVPPLITKVYSRVNSDTDGVYLVGSSIRIIVEEQNLKSGLIGTVEIKEIATSAVEKHTLSEDTLNHYYFYVWNSTGRNLGDYAIETSLMDEMMMRDDPDGSNDSGTDLTIRLVNDGTSPQVTGIQPTGSSVAVNSLIRITFNERMWESYTEQAFSLTDTALSAQVTGIIHWENDTRELVFTPSSALKGNTEYRIIVSADARDYASNRVSNPVNQTFRTRVLTTSGKGTITPKYVSPASHAEFTYTVTPEIESGSNPVSKLEISIPAPHQATSVTSITPPATFDLTTSKITVTLATPMSSTAITPIIVKFTASNPTQPNGPNGLTFSSMVVNSIDEKFPVVEKESGSLRVIAAKIFENIIAEFNPQYAIPERTKLETEYALLPFFTSTNAGINKIKIKMSSNYKITSPPDEMLVKVDTKTYSFTESSENIAEGNFYGATNTDSTEITIILGEKIIQNNKRFSVHYTVTTPASPGDTETGGFLVLSEVGNTNMTTSEVLIESQKGNANNNEYDSNSNRIYTGFPAASINAEVEPTEVVANLTNFDYTVNVRPVLGDRYISIDYLRFNAPTGHIPSSVSSIRIMNGPSVVETFTPVSAKTNDPSKAYVRMSGTTLEVTFGKVLNKSTFTSNPTAFIEVKYKGNTPTTGDSGSVYRVYAGNTPANSYIMATPYDVDGDAISGSLTIRTLAPCNKALGEIVPAYVKPGSSQTYSYYIKLEIDNTVNSGINKFVISPGYHTVTAIESLWIDGLLDTTFTKTLSNGQIVIERATPLMSDTNLKLVFKAQAPSAEDSGIYFLSSVDNTAMNNAVSITGGTSLDGIDNNSENIKVQTARLVNTIIGEVGTSEHIVNTLNGVPSEKEITYTYAFLPSYTYQSIGFDILRIIVPVPHINLDTSNLFVAVGGVTQTIKTGIIGTNEVRVFTDYGIGNSGTIEVTFGQKIRAQVPIQIQFKATTPTIVDGNDIESFFKSEIDFTKAIMTTDVIEGNASDTINGKLYSQKVITMTVPANSVTASIVPNPSWINLTGELFTITITPAFKPSDSGIDKITLNIPSSVTNLTFDSLTVAGIPETSTVARFLNSQLEISGFTKMIYGMSGNIDVSFRFDTGTVPVEVVSFSCIVDDSAKNRGIQIDNINTEIKSPVNSMTAFITPNEVDYGEKTRYEIRTELKIDNTHNTGVDKIKYVIPEGWTDFSGITVNQDGINLQEGTQIVITRPGTHEVEISFLNRLLSDTMIRTFLDMTAQAGNYYGYVSVTAYDISRDSLYFKASEKTAEGLALSTLVPGIKSVTATVTGLKSTGWDINIEAIFTTKMNPVYGKMLIDGTITATSSSFKNQIVDKREVGVWKGYARVKKSIFGNGNVIIKFRSGRDYKDNPVDELVAMLNVAAGASVNAYFDPLSAAGAKDARIYVTSQLSESPVKAMKVKVYEGSTETEITMQPTVHPEIYRGIYRLTRSGSPVIKPVVTDSDGRITECPGITLTARSLGPKGGTIDNGTLKALVPENCLNQENMLVILPYSVEEQQGELIPVDDGYQMGPDKISVNKKMTISFSMNENTQKQIAPGHKIKTALYTIENGRWKFLTTQENMYKYTAELNSMRTYALFKDLTPPKILPSVEDGQILRTNKDPVRATISDEGAGIYQSEVYVDEKLYPARYENGEVVFDNEEGLKEGEHTISFAATDNVGNRQTVSRRFLAPSPVLLRNLTVYPSPASEDITFKYESSADYVDITIFDMYGDEVASLSGTAAGSSNEIVYNLENNSGEKLANGVYFYKVRAFSATGDEEETGKFAVLK